MMFGQVFPSLKQGKGQVRGFVEMTFSLDHWPDYLEAKQNKRGIQAAIVFDWSGRVVGVWASVGM